MNAMSDKFKIDSHKAAFHPKHIYVVDRFAQNNKTAQDIEEFKKLMPVYVEISPFGACNHRCTFCAVDYIGYKTIKLNTDLLIQSLTSMGEGGVKSVMFAGEGEPLLHPDMAKIVNHCHSVGIDTAFTTNGVHLRPKFLEECGANISWIKVSFNAGDSKAYSEIHRTKESDFHKVISNLKHAVKWKKETNAKVALGFQALLLPENAAYMHDLAQLSKEIGMDYLVVKPYSQHKFSDTHQYENINYDDYLYLGEELSKYNDDKFSVVFRANTIKSWISQNDNRYCKCLATPSMWGYIMADGSVYTCSAYMLDERFKLGNINEKTFRDIWCSDAKIKHANFIQNELNIEECRVNCRMNQINTYLDSVVNKDQEHVNFI